ncbi:hypothetical protein C8R44DRAFT_19573 [Mycena epipterygia]|nr:hypothetical protein C8R44DRAFT_19573 [Mycena epipterygia]
MLLPRCASSAVPYDALSVCGNSEVESMRRNQACRRRLAMEPRWDSRKSPAAVLDAERFWCMGSPASTASSEGTVLFGVKSHRHSLSVAYTVPTLNPTLFRFTTFSYVTASWTRPCASPGRRIVARVANSCIRNPINSNAYNAQYYHPLSSFRQKTPLESKLYRVGAEVISRAYHASPLHLYFVSARPFQREIPQVHEALHLALHVDAVRRLGAVRVKDEIAGRRDPEVRLQRGILSAGLVWSTSASRSVIVIFETILAAQKTFRQSCQSSSNASRLDALRQIPQRRRLGME